MTAELEQIIKDDFESWSGGFPPSDRNEIEVYVESSRPGDTDPDEVRAFLIKWMDAQT